MPLLSSLYPSDELISSEISLSLDTETNKISNTSECTNLTHCLRDCPETSENQYSVAECDELSSDEDIDSIVAEFKQQLRVSASGPTIQIAPSQKTARRAFILVILIVFIFFILSSLCINLFSRSTIDLLSASTFFILVLIVALAVVSLSLLILLWRLPNYVKMRGSSLPLAPLTPFITLFLNTALACELLSRTALIFIPVIITGKFTDN